jgi:PXPV repeat (3 copies)
MKRVAAVALLAMLLVPGVALAGSSTDAALGLGAFAVFNQILGGTGLFGAFGHPTVVARPVVAAPAPVVVVPEPVYVTPEPVYVTPPPVYVTPRPVVVAPQPVYVAPRPVYVAPRPVYLAPRPVVVYRTPAYGPYGRHVLARPHRDDHWRR